MPNEDRSQNDPHPEVGPSVSQSRHHSIDSDPDEAPHIDYASFFSFILDTSESFPYHIVEV